MTLNHFAACWNRRNIRANSKSRRFCKSLSILNLPKIRFSRCPGSLMLKVKRTSFSSAASTFTRCMTKRLTWATEFTHLKQMAPKKLQNLLIKTVHRPEEALWQVANRPHQFAQWTKTYRSLSSRSFSIPYCKSRTTYFTSAKSTSRKAPSISSMIKMTICISFLLLGYLHLVWSARRRNNWKWALNLWIHLECTLISEALTEHNQRYPQFPIIHLQSHLWCFAVKGCRRSSQKTMACLPRGLRCLLRSRRTHLRIKLSKTSWSAPNLAWTVLSIG